MDRTRADVAEPAGHADPEGPNEIRIVVVIRVGVIALGVPLVFCRLVEVRIGKEAQADDAARVAEIGADRQARTILERLPPRAKFDAGVLRLVLKRIGRAIGAAHVEPKPEPLRVGSGRLLEAGFVQRAEPMPARIAVAMLTVAVSLARMRGDDLEDIEGCEAVLADAVPEAVVAAGPDDPHIAALDLIRSELRAVVHVMEEVFGGLREARLAAPGP